MDRHIAHVANLFYAASALLGVPSLIGLLYTAANLLLSSPPAGAPLASNADPMLKLIDGAARIAAAPFRFLAWAGQWVMAAVAILSLVILLVSTAFFFTARGLHLAQPWARYSATLLLVMLLAASLALRRSLLFVVLAASLYGFWALWRRPA